VEPEGTHRGGLGAELDRIEEAVDAGDTDLRELGFWRVVALIKRDDEAIERHADQAGRIDAKAFETAVRLRIPVWVGNAILLVVLGVGITAMTLASTGSWVAQDPFWVGLLLVVAGGAWAVAFHSPVHWLVGRVVGIRFSSYFLRSATAPPGLKTDYATYLRTSPTARAWMHASGAIGTKLAPFAALAFAPAAGAPGWATVVLAALGVLMIVTDLLFSTKASDWKKVRRELRVARARRAR
jgi:hypothetical protein